MYVMYTIYLVYCTPVVQGKPVWGPSPSDCSKSDSLMVGSLEGH